MKGVQCYELFGGIALKIHTFSFFSTIIEYLWHLKLLFVKFTLCIYPFHVCKYDVISRVS